MFVTFEFPGIVVSCMIMACCALLTGWRKRWLRLPLVLVSILTVMGVVVTFLSLNACQSTFISSIQCDKEGLLPRPDSLVTFHGKGQKVNVSSNLRCVDHEGKGDVQDTLCIERPNYLANYKNPCWVDWTLQPQRLRCLPYFHVLGVDKCGTTDLYSRLAQHPQVVLNGGELGKETHYWCWHKYGQWFRTIAPKPYPFFYYLNLFDKPAVAIANNTDSDGCHNLITGDGTPMDFWEFRAWPLIAQNEGLSEPVVLTPHLMKHLYPDPKFIVIFRNPVDRLYSDYIFLNYGRTPEKFREDAPKAVAMMDNCLKVNTTRQCVFSNDTYIKSPMRIHVGMYSVFLKEWLAVFPRSNFYILRTEDYHDNMARHLRSIFRFLDLFPVPEQTLQKIVTTARQHETAEKKKVADMFPETRNLLYSFYAKYNEELAALLSDTGFLWSPVDRQT